MLLGVRVGRQAVGKDRNQPEQQHDQQPQQRGLVAAQTAPCVAPQAALWPCPLKWPGQCGGRLGHSQLSPTAIGDQLTRSAVGR
ncbi:MAG TPA: hypothetical protein VGJ87_16005 [Roseiflexaceae bacterium]